MTRVVIEVFHVRTEFLRPRVATVACVATGCGQGRKALCRDTKIVSRHKNCVAIGRCNGHAPARAVERTTGAHAGRRDKEALSRQTTHAALLRQRILCHDRVD